MNTATNDTIKSLEYAALLSGLSMAGDTISKNDIAAFTQPNNKRSRRSFLADATKRLVLRTRSRHH